MQQGIFGIFGENGKIVRTFSFCNLINALVNRLFSKLQGSFFVIHRV